MKIGISSTLLQVQIKNENIPKSSEQGYTATGGSHRTESKKGDFVCLQLTDAKGLGRIVLLKAFIRSD